MALLTTTLLIVLLIGAWYLRSIFMLGFLAVVIAVLLNLPVRFLTKRGIPRGLSVTKADPQITQIDYKKSVGQSNLMWLTSRSDLREVGIG